jgi:hydrogenase maturation protease
MNVVIGYGNPLRGDDGAGPMVAAAVGSSLRGVTVMTPQQLLPEMAAPIARAGLVVFVDAALGDEPGVVSCDPVRGSGTTNGNHTLSPAALLRLTRDAYGVEPPAWLVRIHGQAFDVGAPQSAPVEQALPHAIELVCSLIQTE